MRTDATQADRARPACHSTWTASSGTIRPSIVQLSGGTSGVRLIRVHDTRHTCGALLAALDVHPRIAMQILRHAQISVTMEVYTHVPSEQTRKALRKLGATLEGCV
jgi:integrase